MYMYFKVLTVLCNIDYIVFVGTRAGRKRQRGMGIQSLETDDQDQL